VVAGTWLLGGLAHVVDAHVREPGRPPWQARWGGGAAVFSLLTLLAALTSILGSPIPPVGPIASIGCGLAIGVRNAADAVACGWRPAALALGVAQTSIVVPFFVLHFILPWPGAFAGGGKLQPRAGGTQAEAAVAAFGALLLAWGVLLVTLAAVSAARSLAKPDRSGR
jgi:hypothetical protein